MEQKQVQLAADSFSCPGCGGKLIFDPEAEKLKCPYCGSLVDVKRELVTPMEYDINKALTDKQTNWGGHVRVFSCQGCGAQTVLDQNTTSEVCAFCGSANVLKDQGEAGIAPESVIPFSIPKETAASSFSGWLKGKLFTPRKAKKSCQLDHIQGVYLPHWTYDAKTQSDYTGKEGHAYYVTVDVQVQRDGKTVTEQQQERRIDWRPVKGHLTRDFDDVIVPGSQRLPDELLNRVQPYDLKRLCKYQSAYLAGFMSEKPVRDVKAGFEVAKTIIDKAMRDMAYNDILRHADEAQVDSITSTHSDVKYKLVLLPMWLSSFTYKAKSYHVLVNGANGKVGGQAPISALRVALAIALAAALLLLVYYLFLSGDISVSFY